MIGYQNAKRTLCQFTMGKLNPFISVVTITLVLGACSTQSSSTPTAAEVVFVKVTPTLSQSPTVTISLTPSSQSSVETSIPNPTNTSSPTPHDTNTPTASPTLTPTSMPTSTPDEVAPPSPNLITPRQGEELECEPGQKSRRVRIEVEPVSDPSGIATYTLFIEPNVSFVASEDPKATFLEVDADCGESYTWTVSAIDGAGNESPKSSPEHIFSVISADEEPPSVPQLISPPDMQYFICNKGEEESITFQWNTSVDNQSGIAGYYFARLRDGDSDWTYSDLLNKRSLTQSVRCGYWYFWTVLAIDKKGNRSNWDRSYNTYRVYVGPDNWPPDTPRLNSPSPGAPLKCGPGSEKRSGVILDWTRVEDHSGIDNYYIQVRAIYDDGNYPIIINDNTQSTSYTTRSLSCNLAYEWRVIAKDKSGNFSQVWSRWRRFKIED